MFSKSIRVLFCVVVVSIAWGLGLDGLNHAQAEEFLLPQPQYDLFYNYYVAPSRNGGVGAQLYVSPLPTPPFVGHTYMTYQPLMPHEFMHPHCRCYHRCKCGIIPTASTCVIWW